MVANPGDAHHGKFKQSGVSLPVSCFAASTASIGGWNRSPARLRALLAVLAAELRASKAHWRSTEARPSGVDADCRKAGAMRLLLGGTRGRIGATARDASSRRTLQSRASGGAEDEAEAEAQDARVPMVSK